MSKITKRKSVNMVGSQEDEDDESQDLDNQGMEEAIQDFAEGKNIIKLYRHPNELTGGRPRLLCSLAREDFNDVYVLNRFGGGKYFGRWRLKNGQYTRFNFDIDGEPKVQTLAAEKAAQQEEDAEKPSGPYGFERRDEEGQRMETIGAGDILRIVAETRRESREEMRMLLELMRPTSQPPDATEKVFSLVEKIVPLISQGGGDGSGGNPWLFALSQLKEPLMKMVDTIHTAVTRGPVQTGPSPTGAPIPTDKRIVQPAPAQPIQPTPDSAPLEPQTPKNEDDMLVDSFRPHLGLLIHAAETEKDVALYTDLVLDLIPVFAYDRLRVWLNKPGCLDQLEAVSPRRYSIRERVWFEALRAQLLSALNEELGVNATRTIQPQPDRDPATPSPTDCD